MFKFIIADGIYIQNIKKIKGYNIKFNPTKRTSVKNPIYMGVKFQPMVKNYLFCEQKYLLKCNDNLNQFRIDHNQFKKSKKILFLLCDR